MLATVAILQIKYKMFFYIKKRRSLGLFQLRISFFSDFLCLNSLRSYLVKPIWSIYLLKYSLNRSNSCLLSFSRCLWQDSIYVSVINPFSSNYNRRFSICSCCTDSVCQVVTFSITLVLFLTIIGIYSLIYDDSWPNTLAQSFVLTTSVRITQNSKLLSIVQPAKYFLMQISGFSRRMDFFLQNSSSVMMPSRQISSKAYRIIIFLVDISTNDFLPHYCSLSYSFFKPRQDEMPLTNPSKSGPTSPSIISSLFFQISIHLLLPLDRQQWKGVYPSCSSSLRVTKMTVPSGMPSLNFWISDMMPLQVLELGEPIQFLKLFWLPKDILSAASLMVTILKVWLLSVLMCWEAQARSQNFPN